MVSYGRTKYLKTFWSLRKNFRDGYFQDGQKSENSGFSGQTQKCQNFKNSQNTNQRVSKMEKNGVHNFFQLQKLRKLWNFEFSNFRLFIFLNFHLLLKCCFKKQKKGLKLKSVLIEHLNMTPKDCPKELLQNLEHHVNDSVQNTRNNPFTKFEASIFNSFQVILD